ncbi:MAG TPA: hypothetical protein VLA49_09590 [Anaerolineales bacterium]|nr:hypothetical protein [Anaerolineales bacterium]
MSILKKLFSRSSNRPPSPPAQTLPNPTQRSMDILIEKVTRARILAGGVSQGKALGDEVLLDVADPQAVIALRECLTIVEDERTFGHCMCLGDQALELYAGEQLAATIGLHHGRSIRWEAWKYDALLKDGLRLLAWMAEQGLTSPLEAFQEAQLREYVQRQALARWQQAMPACLYPFAEQMLATSGGMASFIPLAHQGQPGRIEEVTAKLAPLLEVLAVAYPQVEARILALLQWYGSGLGPWSGFPAYESVAEGLLLAFPLDQLLAALTHPQLAPAQLEGAARFFAGYDFSKYRAAEIKLLPADLKQQLLEHSFKTEDDDRIQRAKNAFASPTQT